MYNLAKYILLISRGVESCLMGFVLPPPETITVLSSRKARMRDAIKLKRDRIAVKRAIKSSYVKLLRDLEPLQP